MVRVLTATRKNSSRSLQMRRVPLLSPTTLPSNPNKRTAAYPAAPISACRAEAP
jgi:hypothetical protein